MNTSQDTIDWLAALAERGLSASQIAGVMKRSRNSVIGLCDRNGIKLQGGVDLPVSAQELKETMVEKRKPGRPKGFKLSAEQRRHHSELMRKSWAARKAAGVPRAKEKGPRNLSPASRAARSERLKRVWAIARAHQQAAE